MLKFILTSADIDDEEDVEIEPLKLAISRFSDKISERWEKSHRKRDDFVKKYSDWLDSDDFGFGILVNKHISERSGRLLVLVV